MRKFYKIPVVFLVCCGLIFAADTKPEDKNSLEKQFPTNIEDLGLSDSPVVKETTKEEKKQKEARKGIKKGVVKDIKLSLFIGPADLDRMIRRGIEFLKDGNQVRLNLGLRGREMGKTKMAFDLIHKCITMLGDVNVAKEPKLEGRVVRAVVAKKK